MQVNSNLADLFKRIGQPLRAKQAEHLTARIQDKGSIIVLASGKIYADTKQMRVMQYGKGYVVTETEVYDIPLTFCSTPTRNAKRMRMQQRHEDRAVKKSTADTPLPRRFTRLESGKRMFAIGKGERSRKKPGNGGRFVPNAPLRGMGLSRADYERNRPDFIDYIKYISK